MPAPTTIGETLRDEIIAECKRAGFEPRIVQESSDIAIILGLVSAGMGCGTNAARVPVVACSRDAM